MTLMQEGQGLKLLARACFHFAEPLFISGLSEKNITYCKQVSDLWSLVVKFKNLFLDEDEDSPMIRGFSDDEPLVIA